MREFQPGYTLVEMMVSIVIISILLMIGVPSYSSVTTSNRISYEVNELMGDIELGRSEALKRGLTVIVCPSTDGINCSTGTNWAQGWVVFTSTGDCTSSTGQVVRIKQALAGNDTAVFTANVAGNDSLCFTRSGLLSSDYNGMFFFNAASPSSSYLRCVTVSAMGRAQSYRNGQLDASGNLCQ